MIEYTFVARIISVEEKFTTKNYRVERDPATGQTSWQCDRVSLGWFVRYTESSAIRVGATRPDLNVGDEIEVVLRHAL
jgi:hypothetical protein